MNREVKTAYLNIYFNWSPVRTLGHTNLYSCICNMIVHYRDAGMRYMIGPDWMDLFDMFGVSITEMRGCAT
jgi:hypothetical protein